MIEVNVLVGLPGAGKTSIAQEIVKRESTKRTLIVSCDMLREMLYGKYEYREEQEPIIYRAVTAIIDACINDGLNVIIDDTMLVLTKTSRKHLINYIRSREYKAGNIHIRAILFTYYDECIQRRMNDNRGIDPLKWKQIIEEMFNTFEPVSFDEDFNSIIKSTEVFQ